MQQFKKYRCRAGKIAAADKKYLCWQFRAYGRQKMAKVALCNSQSTN